MNKKVIIPTILFIAVFIVSVVILFQNKENDLANNIAEENQQMEEAEIILFYGDGCPHCAIVDNYIKSNNIKERLSFDEKEVYYNRKNAEELASKAKICDIPTDYIGVPFLWDGSKCYVGDQEITDFFNQEINEN